MAKLTLDSLTCLRKQDVAGKDEPRLSVDDRPVWDGSIDKGSTVSVGRTVIFTGTARVKLEEMNDNGTDPKQIGAVLSVSAKGGNPSLGVFKNAGTHYQLDYRVLPD